MYILEVFMATLLYADNMALLAPSVNGLQLLLDKYSIIISNGTSLSIRNNLKSCILKKKHAAIMELPGRTSCTW